MRLMMIACTVGAVLMALPVSATVRYCAPEPLGNDANDGLTPETPQTFSYSVSHMGNNDELRILAGTYHPAAGALGSHVFNITGPRSFCGWSAQQNSPADPKDVIIDLESKNGLFYSVRGLSVSSVTIQNGYVSSDGGGAICLWSNNAYDTEPAVLSNCVFIANGTASSINGGAVLIKRPTTVVDCCFDGNTGGTDAGALYLSQSSKAIGCTFVGNRAEGKGGALYSGGASEIVQCVFSNNVSKSFGGAIYGSSDFLQGCTIVSNRSENCGGGYAWSGSALTVLDDCTFSNNVQIANGNWACGGGAMYCDYSGGRLSMTNCTLVCNRSTCQGGAVLMRYAALFEAFGCKFGGNYAAGTTASGYAQKGCGAMLWFYDATDGSTNRLADCTVRNHHLNPAAPVGNISGGVIYSTAKTTIVSGCSFSNETCQASYVYEFGGSVSSTVSNCTFACVTNSHSTATLGGVAHVSSSCTVTDCSFRNNQAGKGMLLTGGTATTTNAYRNCVFENNYSRNAPLVSSSAAFLEVADCSFKDNVLNNGYAATAGGICIGAGDKVAIDRCMFVNNTNDVNTGASGGAIFLYSTSAADPSSHIRNCLFNGNACGWHANRFGPSICLNAGTTSAIPIENCTFVNHTLGKAPVQCLNGTSWTEKNLVNCVFAGNKSAQPSTNLDHSWQGSLVDAGFVDAAAGDYRPAKGSVLVNEGQNAEWMTNAYDLLNSRKVPRIIGGTVDIGCYEYRSESGLSIFVK